MTRSSDATVIPPKSILFVCIGNSCRSQMAEAFARQLGGDAVRASSAGSHPLGWILPDTIAVMAEKGIALDGQRSKGIWEVPIDQMDVVVGMGCEVACPVPVGFKGRIVEWNIPDPYARDLDFFRQVRDQIEAEVQSLLSSILTPA
ncbi:MAG TPA: arsenate reductase ArsC [Terriglobia bacterium]|nr:arsenate reductase ArsC [Terriglobia bacterium]